ncbi:MAG: DNA-binding protein WhiA, partial [Bacilli bacterium]|nr:DNA-binding protein WhiA [Bacilli bacterium]
IKDIYDVKCSFTYTRQLRLQKKLIYHIQAEEKVTQILEDLEIYKDFQAITPKLFLNKKYFRPFVIGTFLASGQVSDPKSGRYFCEMVFNRQEDAKVVLRHLLRFNGEDSMSFKIITRRNKYVLYLKKSDQISVFLGFIGAVSLMFDFENARLERDYFNNENRLEICAQANYSKALKTGQKNISDIKIIEDKLGDIYFSDRSRLLADLRKENKDASYQELANMALRRGLSITKSGVVHIFLRFSKDAERLSSGDKIEGKK